MEGTVLINTVGITPMVVTELFQYLKDIENITRIKIIYTSDEEVLSGVRASIGALLNKNPHLFIDQISLNLEDIQDEKSLFEYLEVLVNVIHKERVTYHTKRIIFNATGGRKNQSMLVSSLAGLIGIDQMFTIVHKYVKNYNLEYERVKDKILTFKDLNNNFEDFKNHYKTMVKDLDPIFFPRMQNLELIEIPIIKIPDDIKGEIRRAIEGMQIEDVEEYRLKAYKRSGLISYDRSRTYGNTLGEIISKLL